MAAAAPAKASSSTITTTTTTSKGSGPSSQSHLTRALWASPLLLLSVVAVYGINATPFAHQFEHMLETGEFDLAGNSMPIYKTFLDTGSEVERYVGLLATVFVQLINEYDPITYWQTFSFIIDAAGMFGVFLLESSRATNYWTPLAVPFLWAVASQARGIGVFGPIYFFFLHIYGSPTRLVASGAANIRLNHTWRVVPLIAIFYLIPAFSMYTDCNQENKIYWDWVWQVFPVFVSLGFDTVGTVLHLFQPKQPSSQIDLTVDLPLIFGTSIMFVAVGTATYMYTMIKSGLMPWQLWVPAQLTGHTDAVTALRAALQWDQVCSYGAAYGWLVLQFAELMEAGYIETDWLSLAVTAVVLLFTGGPGSLFMLAWVYREISMVMKVIEQQEAAKESKKEQ